MNIKRPSVVTESRFKIFIIFTVYLTECTSLPTVKRSVRANDLFHRQYFRADDGAEAAIQA